jgi:hypothetical protein
MTRQAPKSSAPSDNTPWYRAGSHAGNVCGAFTAGARANPSSPGTIVPGAT